MFLGAITDHVSDIHLAELDEHEIARGSVQGIVEPLKNLLIYHGYRLDRCTKMNGILVLAATDSWWI